MTGSSPSYGSGLVLTMELQTLVMGLQMLVMGLPMLDMVPLMLVTVHQTLGMELRMLGTAHQMLDMPHQQEELVMNKSKEGQNTVLPPLVTTPLTQDTQPHSLDTQEADELSP